LDTYATGTEGTIPFPIHSITAFFYF
jgi:hypothetical protein